MDIAEKIYSSPDDTKYEEQNDPDEFTQKIMLYGGEDCLRYFVEKIVS